MNIRLLLESVVERTAIGAFAAGVGCLIAAVGFGAYHYDENPETTLKWSAAIGFALGAIFGNHSLAARPAWIVSGVVAGIAFGAVAGHFWGRFEQAVDLRQIEAAGRLPAETKGGGLRTHGYDDIGVRYGIGLGAIVGFAVGLSWKRRSKAIWTVTVASACVLFAVIRMMNAEFRSLSIEEIRYSHPKIDETVDDGDV